MNKMIKMVTFLVTLTAVLGFSQEKSNAFQLGARLGFLLSDPTGKNSDHMDMGWGFGGGLAFNIPIAGSFSINPEFNFLYKRLLTATMDDEYDEYETDIYESELVLSIPAMVQFNPVAGFYVAAGIQLDIPFNSEISESIPLDPEMSEFNDDVRVTMSFKDFTGVKRSAIDFGIALGAGYYITEKVGVDFRVVLGLTNYADNDDVNVSANQYGLGVTYYFL